MEAKVIQFRRGRHRIHERHFLIEIPGVSNREEAQKFAGKEVVWISPGKLKKEIKGKVSAAHGTKGAVRAIFETGMPGQSVSTSIEFK